MRDPYSSFVSINDLTEYADLLLWYIYSNVSFPLFCAITLFFANSYAIVAQIGNMENNVHCIFVSNLTS